MAQLLALPLARITDANGNPLAGAKLYPYLTLTTTPTPTYTTSALSVQHPNPVVADANGLLPPIFIDPSVVYRFKAKTSAGADISGMDWDPVSVTSSGEIQFGRPGQGSRPVEEKLLRFLEVEDFRYDEDGVERTDLETFTAANAAWMAQGGGVLLAEPKRTYNMGSYEAGEHEILPVIDLDNAIFDGRGCRFVVTVTEVDAMPLLWVLRGYRQLTLANFRVRGVGTDLTQEWQGVFAIQPRGDTAGKSCNGLTIHNVDVKDAVAFLFCDGTVTAVTGITISGGCVAESCYYGIVTAEAGNDLVAELRTVNPRRSYFPYGVRGHKVTIHFSHGGGAIPGAEAACLIKRYHLNTREIDLTIYVGAGSLANHVSLVKCEHQPDSGTSRISGVRVQYHVDEQTAVGTCIPFRMSSYTSGGVEETTTTSNVWERYSLHGGLDWAADTQIEVRAKPAIVADVALDADTCVNPLKITHKHNVRFVTAHGREFYTKKGDLTAAVFQIDLSRFDNVSLVGDLNITLMGATAGSAVQHRTCLHSRLYLTIPTGGPLTVDSSPTVSSDDEGTAATIGALTVSGKILQIPISGADYAGPNAFGLVELGFRTLAA